MAEPSSSSLQEVLDRVITPQSVEDVANTLQGVNLGGPTLSLLERYKNALRAMMAGTSGFTALVQALQHLSAYGLESICDSDLRFITEVAETGVNWRGVDVAVEVADLVATISGALRVVGDGARQITAEVVTDIGGEGVACSIDLWEVDHDVGMEGYEEGVGGDKEETEIDEEEMGRHEEGFIGEIEEDRPGRGEYGEEMAMSEGGGDMEF